MKQFPKTFPRANIIRPSLMMILMMSLFSTFLSSKTYAGGTDTIKPVLTLLGANPYKLEVFKAFADPGVSISDPYFTAEQLMHQLQITDSINDNVLGTYTVTYNLTDSFGNKAIPVVRTVDVVDTIPPTLKLIGPSHDSVLISNKYTDRGYTVMDNYYPNISVSISGSFVAAFKNNYATRPGNYTYIYTATDGSGNKSSVTRYVKVYDNIPVFLTLIGPVDVNVCRFAVYKDLGYKVDSSGFSSITVDTGGSFLKSGTSMSGIYQLTYTAKDTLGNSASVSRNIIVEQSGSFGCTSSIANASNSLSDIKLYPNPASENIKIDPGSQKITDIRMVNELGMLIFDWQNPEAGILQIPVSQYKPGVYIVMISTEKGTVVRRIIKN